jgi:hypothetical protein
MKYELRQMREQGSGANRINTAFRENDPAPMVAGIPGSNSPPGASSDDLKKSLPQIYVYAAQARAW